MREREAERERERGGRRRGVTFSFGCVKEEVGRGETSNHDSRLDRRTSEILDAGPCARWKAQKATQKHT